MSASSFFTPDGVSAPAVTAKQMREVDRLANEELGPNLFQMMENAGRNLAISVIERLGPDWVNLPIVVLAGSGGNGGGGICAARHLANRGADVTVVVTNPALLGDVTAGQLGVYRATDGKIVAPHQVVTLDAAMVVDAVIGYSLSGPPRGVAADLIEWANLQGAPVLALDVPSGIDSTSGEAPGSAVEASVTMTLALPKSGLDAGEVGELWLGDIGVPVAVYRRMGLDVPPGLFASGYRVRLRAG